MTEAAGRREPSGAMSRAALAVVVVVVVTALTGCGSAAAPAAPPSPSESRDPSGLVILPPDDLTVMATPVAVPDGLDPAYLFARMLAEDNPTDFGFSRIEGDHVLLPVTSALSQPLLKATDGDARKAALLAYDEQVRARFPAHPNPPDLLKKRLQLTPERLQQFADHVRVDAEPVSLSDADELRERATDLVIEPTYADAKAWESTYDEHLGKVVLTMERLTPQLATALVKAFGTDGVAVRLEPDPGAGF